MDKTDFIEWVSKLQNSFQPAEEIRAKLSQVDLVAIVGPTGVGKSTIMDNLGLPVVLSDVSREKRPDEKDNKNYHFRTDYLDIIDDIKNGQYVQFLVSIYNEFYGTRISAYPESGQCTMAVVADHIDSFRKLGFRKIIPIYVMPPSYVEWMRRIGGVRTNDLLMRIKEARRSILIGIEDEEYTFVLNDDIKLATSEIQAILRGEEIDAHRAQLARDTADIILERIGDEE